MRTNTSEKIITYIKERNQATPHELVEYLGISPQAVHKQLKKLLEAGRVNKIGKNPKVFYVLSSRSDRATSELFIAEQKKIIEKNYLYVSPVGELIEGVDGFIQWCKKTKQPIEKTAKEYIETLKKYDALRIDDLLEGTQKLNSSFDEVFLDKLFYLDFYSIERFGKTKLGQMLLYAKQSQNKNLMKQLTQEVRPTIEQIIARFDIDAVGFIPPTVKRELQFIFEFEKQLQLQLPVIKIIKVIGDVAVPQKTLTKKEDRVENAQKSIIVTEKNQYRNILLIDDAVGSGATLNETAKKIKEQKIALGKVIGLSITGSYKGFDVISEV